MRIQLQTPNVLRAYAADNLKVEFSGRTMADLLEGIRKSHPSLHQCICDETGKLRPHINLFIGNEMFDRRDYTRSLRSGQVVSVYQAVSGG